MNVILILDKDQVFDIVMLTKKMEVIQSRDINKSVKFINKLSFCKRAFFLIIYYPVFLTYPSHKFYCMLQKKIHEVHTSSFTQNHSSPLKRLHECEKKPSFKVLLPQFI